MKLMKFIEKKSLYCSYHYISLYLLLKCAIFLYMIFARKKKTNKSNIKKVICVLEF